MSYQGLTAYQKAFELAMNIYLNSKQFPYDERYGLTDQVRRSSRAVCANIAEGYRKRQYPAHFVSKMSDADMENSETQVWLEFALHCKYLHKESFDQLSKLSSEVGRLLQHIIRHPERYGAIEQPRKTKQ